MIFPFNFFLYKYYMDLNPIIQPNLKLFFTPYKYMAESKSHIEHILSKNQSKYIRAHV